ncbi:MAG TPA: PspC domain-containing protein [Candidatus Dormibacteraeota bacterium]|nr:PspC domain-containing protein [Candidatus Dormibacteraeota bacterium]
MSRRLFRSRDDRMLAGVAGGLAELWDADPSLVRVVWAILVPFTGGFALLAYVIMALVVPEEEDEPVAYAQPAARSSSPPPSPPASPTDVGAPPPAEAESLAPVEPLAASSPPPDWRSARRDARAARRAARRDHRAGPGSIGLLIGALLVVAGIYFLVREYIPDIDLNWLWPAALIALGVVVLLAAFRRPPPDAAPPDDGPSA